MSEQFNPPDGVWGWMVVFGAFIVNVITDGCSYSFGVLLPSLIDYFHESRSKTAWIGSLLYAMPLLCGPFASITTKRLGHKKAVILGGLITTVGFFSSAFVNSVNAMIITYGLIAGVGISLSYLNCIVVVASYFKKKRTLAAGIAESGAGIGTLIIVPFYQFLTETYNWRGAVIIMSGISLNIVICGALFRPLHYKKQTDKSNNSSTGIEVSVFTIEENKNLEYEQRNVDRKWFLEDSLLRNKFFLLFTFSRIVLYFWFDVPYIFTVDRLRSLNIDDKQSAFVLSIIGITHAAGNLFYGFLGDRNQLNRNYLYSISTIIAGLAIAVVPTFTSYVQNAVISGLYGLLSASSETLKSAIIIDVVGTKKLTNAFGIMMFFEGVGNLVGPPVAGWLYDMSGSYNHTFYSAGICIAGSGIMVLVPYICLSYRTNKK